MATQIIVNGRIIAVNQITHAVIVKDNLTISPVEYHDLVAGGDEMKAAVASLKEAGFIEQDSYLINPERVSVLEPQLPNYRLYLEGADRILFVASGFVEKYAGFLAQESEPEVKTEGRKKAMKKPQGAE